jgi:multidrug transporter EmrE-like cation transporter
MMMPSCECAVFWSLALLALGGATSVVAAVRCQAALFQKLCQRLFVCCLVGLGATTMLALTLNNSAWIPCAVAYALLSVAATVDFTPRREVSARFF